MKRACRLLTVILVVFALGCPHLTPTPEHRVKLLTEAYERALRLVVHYHELGVLTDEDVLALQDYEAAAWAALTVLHEEPGSAEREEALWRAIDELERQILTRAMAGEGGPDG